MPAHTTVAVGTTVAAITVGVQSYLYYRSYLQKRDEEALKQAALAAKKRREEWLEEAEAEKEGRQRGAEAGQSQGGGGGGDSRELPRTKLMNHAVELFQLRLLSALDGLATQLRGCGVGGGLPVALPGEEDVDKVTACVALLFGTRLWQVLSGSRASALMTYGGTLSTFSPLSSRVVGCWLEQLAAGGSGLPPEEQLSDWTLRQLLLVLLSAVDMKMQPNSQNRASWACLFKCPTDEVAALTALVEDTLPGMAVRPHVLATFHSQLRKHQGSNQLLIRARSSQPYPASASVLVPPGDNDCWVLLAFCMPYVVELVVREDELNSYRAPHGAEFFKPWQRPWKPGDGVQLISPEKLQKAMVDLLVRVFVRRAATEAQRRVEQLPGPWGEDSGGGSLAGCGWEHCAALAGEMQPAEALLQQHEAWWQASDLLQGPEQQRRVSAMLRDRLLKALPPPAPPPPLQPSFPKDGRGDGGGSSSSEHNKKQQQQQDHSQQKQQQQQLEAEVDAFVADLLPLTHAAYMQTHRGGGGGGGGGKLAEEAVATKPVTEVVMVDMVKCMPQEASLRVMFRKAHRERAEALAALIHPPPWLGPACFYGTVLLIAVLLYALQYVLLTSAQGAMPQLAALLLDLVDSAGAAAASVAVRLRVPRGLLRCLAAGLRLLHGTTLLWLWLPATAYGVRTVTQQLPEAAEGLVTAVADAAGLGNFMGRYRLSVLQQRVRRQKAVWAARLAEARMREALGRGRIGWRDLQDIMAGLQAAAAAAVDATTSGAADDAADVGPTAKRFRLRARARGGGRGGGVVEVTLPGSEEEVEAFLQLPVEQPEKKEETGKDEGTEREEGTEEQWLQVEGDAGAAAVEDLEDLPGPPDETVGMLFDCLMQPPPAPPPEAPRALPAAEEKQRVAGKGTGKEGGGLSAVQDSGRGGEASSHGATRRKVQARRRKGTAAAAASASSAAGPAPAPGEVRSAPAEVASEETVRDGVSRACHGDARGATAATATKTVEEPASGAAAASSIASFIKAFNMWHKGRRSRKAVSKVLEEDGWVPIRRGKHVVYRRELGGITQTFVRSTTPSDRRTAANQLATLRRANMAVRAEMSISARVMLPFAARVAERHGAASAVVEGVEPGAGSAPRVTPGAGVGADGMADCMGHYLGLESPGNLMSVR